MTIVIGILFLAAGIAVGGSMLGFFDLSISMRGWWTIFIIAPALISMVQGGPNAGNIIVLGVGVILLLKEQGIMPEVFSWRLIFPVVLLAVGFQLLFGGSRHSGRYSNQQTDRHQDTAADGSHDAENNGFSSRADDNASGEKSGERASGGGIYTEASKPGASYKTASALFGSQDICYGPELFTGGSYTAVFGGLTINLCNVKFDGDVVINVSAIFGGIDLILPSNVQIVSNVAPILGGIDIKYASSRDPSARRIIVNGTASFGGVTIK
jgi:hypothetical protein